VIEDEPQVRLLVVSILEAAGYRVLEAANGHDGLRLFDEIAVDLVLVDILMPEMDGLELITRLRRARPASRIIAMSGGIEQWNYLDVATHLGAQATLQKPFSPQELLDAVRAQLPT
jgi:DNA-binding response OmpR family regulator